MKKLVLLSCVAFSTGSMQADNAVNSVTVRLHSQLSNPLKWQARSLDEIPRLIFDGANPCWIGSDGFAAVHNAARLGLDDDLYKSILEAIRLMNCSVDLQDSKGYSALCHAALNGKIETIRLLQANGANVNYQTPNEYYTPLHFAVFGSKPLAVQALKELGATEVEDLSGKTPSRYARRTSVDVPGNRSRMFENREQLLQALQDTTS